MCVNIILRIKEFNSIYYYNTVPVSLLLSSQEKNYVFSKQVRIYYFHLNFNKMKIFLLRPLL